MITATERAMLASDFAILRGLWILRARAEAGRINDDRRVMRDRGFEEVDTSPGAIVLPDGREVMHAAGRNWALRMDVHTARLEDAFRRANHDPRPGECLASVLCPACRAVMAKSPICPNCAKGKAGYKILCTCTECAHEVYL